MSDTSVQTAPSAPPPARPQPRRKSPLRAAVEAVGSLRVTVTLFALSLALVFFGTLAQIDAGIWTVVKEYFRSFFVLMPLQLLVQFGQVFFGLPKTMKVPGAVPFPGGWTIGILLMVNLAAAYSLRLPGYMKRWRSYLLMAGVLGVNFAVGYLTAVYLDQWWFLVVAAVQLVVTTAALTPFRRHIFFPGNRIGILTLHVGLVFMMAGELITGLYAVEGNMVIEKGETTSAVMHNRFYELAVIDPSDEAEDRVTVVPARLLRAGAEVRHGELPFDVDVVSWMANSNLATAAKGAPNPGDAGFGTSHVAVEQAEVSGAATSQTVETPSMYATLTDKASGARLGTYLFSVLLNGQKVKAGGKEYDVALRFKRTYKPYSLHLKEFTFQRYRGSEKAKDFVSQVRLVDPERGDDRDVTIRMNFPMRHRGDTFFQADWNKETEAGTVLQVVRNPAWQLPYWSCAIVSVGMLMHFGLNLINFLGRRAGE